MTTLGMCRGDGNIPYKEWFDIWGDGDDCYNIVYDDLYSSNIGGQDVVKYNPSKLPLYQSAAEAIFQKYLRKYEITEPGQTGYDPFQEVLHRWCRRLPGVCQTAVVNQVCPALSDPLNREKISQNRQILRFCGCYSANQVYPNNTIISKQCDPLCSRIDVLPLQDSSGNRLSCDADICVINDISISATNSYVQGGIGFAQLCNTCQSGNCKCIISLPDIQQSLSELGIADNFIQLCGDTSVCQVIDPDNPQAPPTIVPCAESLTQFNIQPVEYEIPLWFWIVIIAVVIFFFVLLILIGSYRSKSKYILPGGIIKN